MKRPNKISAQQKLKESKWLNSAIKSSSYTQTDIAAMLGTEQSHISPWFKKNPNAIPDWAFLVICNALELDASKTRPWLLDMYHIMENVFSNENKKRLNTRAKLLALVDLMSPEEQIQLAGKIAGSASKKISSNPSYD